MVSLGLVLFSGSGGCQTTTIWPKLKILVEEVDYFADIVHPLCALLPRLNRQHACMSVQCV